MSELAVAEFVKYAPATMLGSFTLIVASTLVERRGRTAPWPVFLAFYVLTLIILMITVGLAWLALRTFFLELW